MASSSSSNSWRSVFSPRRLVGKLRDLLSGEPKREPPPAVEPDAAECLRERGAFPVLPDFATAPESVREAVCRGSREIVRGRWPVSCQGTATVAFPPLWQRDYLGGCQASVATPSEDFSGPAVTGLENLQKTAVLELNSWVHLTRVAQAARFEEDAALREFILAALEDWVKNNPPGFGLNWTVPAGAAARLSQFVWIDALLRAAGIAGDDEKRLTDLAAAIIPKHLRWLRLHADGDLTALSAALTTISRWPGATVWWAPTDEIREAFAREIQRQIAADGGHLGGSHEGHFQCWQAAWLAAAAIPPMDNPVADRLAAAARFFVALTETVEPWPFGAAAAPAISAFPANPWNAAPEWHDWLLGRESAALQFWLGQAPATGAALLSGWEMFPESGWAVGRCHGWTVQMRGGVAVDAAAHADALQVSIWKDGAAVVIDPGSSPAAGGGLREFLASAEAHNGPHFASQARKPKHHRTSLNGQGGRDPEATISWNDHHVTRTVRIDRRKIVVTDMVTAPDGEFAMHWQFAPDIIMEGSGNCYVAAGTDACYQISFRSAAPLEVHLVSPEKAQSLHGTCISPGGAVARSPMLRVRGKCQGAVTVEMELEPSALL